MFIFLLLALNCANAATLPVNFVYLYNIDPTIQQNIRYASSHNFIGRRIKGYESAKCILTKSTALTLAQAQKELNKHSLSLKVYDCYRPQMAVNDFIQWSQVVNQQEMKAEFYPRVNKKDFFNLGYVAAKSGHSRGSTVDLTIIPIVGPKQATYQSQQKLVACFAPYGERFQDNSIDMGTGFDCMDETAHYMSLAINKNARKNRNLLHAIMIKYGFKPYSLEWWHFTLKNEPYPNTYFNFPVM